MAPKFSQKDPRNRATAIIWGFATGMFALCVPLTAVAQSGPILPLLVIMGAGGGTVVVWRSPSQRSREDALRIKALEERVINLETIYTSLPDTDRSLQILNTEKR